MVQTRFDRNALEEVYQVITLFQEENYNKLPEELIQTIDLNRNKEYKVNINELFNGKMLKDTENILCAIYYKYLSTNEERKVIDSYKLMLKQKELETDFDIFGKNKEEEKEKYNNIDSLEQTKEELSLTIARKNIIQKILNKIKNMFRKL